LIARIRTVAWAGPEIEITPPQKLVVRLVRVEAEAETVLQGDLAKGPVCFYFFANVPSDNGYNTYLSWLEPNLRYVLFLRKDGGGLRTMADVAGLNIRVRSGHHGEIPLLQGRPATHDPGASIAYVALTPSTDYEDGFAKNIEYALGKVRDFAGRAELFRLLRKLLAQPDLAIQGYACLSLVRNYGYLDPCLPGLVDSQVPEIRQQARLEMRGPASANRAILQTLKDDPLSLCGSGRAEDVAASLEVFTFDSDARVREQACGALHRFFASRQFQNCLSVRGAK
jgi:hypothetical protein